MGVGVCSDVSDSLRPHGLRPTRLLCPWNFPGKNTGVGCHFLLQGIFLTKGLNLGLLHWQAGSLPAEPLGKTPEELEWKLILPEWEKASPEAPKQKELYFY